MKKSWGILVALSVAAGSVEAGSLKDPVVQPQVIREDAAATSSAPENWIAALFVLLILVAVTNGGGGSGGVLPL